MSRTVQTAEDAVAAYFDVYGAGADQPAGGSEYDLERGVWVLENIRGVLALVHDDGSVEEPIQEEWEDYSPYVT